MGNRTGLVREKLNRMQEFDQLVTRQRKWMLYILSAFILLAAAIPEKRPLFLGLVLGSVFSYYGMRLLQNRLRAFGETALESGKVKGLGTFVRMLGAVLLVFLTFYLGEKVNYYAVIIGLGISYVVLLVDATIYYVWKDLKK